MAHDPLPRENKPPRRWGRGEECFFCQALRSPGFPRRPAGPAFPPPRISPNFRRLAFPREGIHSAHAWAGRVSLRRVGGAQKILRVSGTRNEWGEEMSGGPGPPEIRRIKADAGREGAEIFPACAGGARPVLGDEGRLEANGNFGEKSGCGAGGAGDFSRMRGRCAPCPRG